MDTWSLGVRKRPQDVAAQAAEGRLGAHGFEALSGSFVSCKGLKNYLCYIGGALFLL